MQMYKANTLDHYAKKASIRWYYYQKNYTKST